MIKNERQFFQFKRNHLFIGIKLTKSKSHFNEKRKYININERNAENKFCDKNRKKKVSDSLHFSKLLVNIFVSHIFGGIRKNMQQNRIILSKNTLKILFNTTKSLLFRNKNFHILIKNIQYFYYY